MDKNSKGFLYIINTALELVIAIAAIAMFKLGKFTPAIVLNQIQPIWIQILIGITAGAGIGFLCGKMVTSVKFFSPVLDMVNDLVLKYKLNIFDIFIISITAAICEELLFRGAIQRLWGVWPASVLFILLHGYFNPKNLKIMLYGVIMLVLSAAIGYSYKYLGLYAAIIFHLTFDFAALVIVQLAGAKK